MHIKTINKLSHYSLQLRCKWGLQYQECIYSLYITKQHTNGFVKTCFDWRYANSAEPIQTPQHAASDLGLHCLGTVIYM